MATPLIEIDNVHQRFGELEVLKGVSLKMNRGETVVILGGSGGGKSVLMKHIIGLLQPVKGSVKIEGQEISNLKERELAEVRRKMGMMFQNGALFDSLTVGQNIAFPLREGGLRDEEEIAKRVEEALAIVKLPDLEAKMPSELSGGMRKRVALARAVVDRPCLILYDEPHAGLDPVTADNIDHLIKDLQTNHGITNVIITHEMRSVFRIADRVVFMKEGKIYWEGTPEELSASQDQILQDFIHGRSAGSW